MKKKESPSSFSARDYVTTNTFQEFPVSRRAAVCVCVRLKIGFLSADYALISGSYLPTYVTSLDSSPREPLAITVNPKHSALDFRGSYLISYCVEVIQRESVSQTMMMMHLRKLFAHLFQELLAKCSEIISRRVKSETMINKRRMTRHRKMVIGSLARDV